MLAHVTFHNSNSTSAIEWVNYNSVLATLEEMETGYTAFQRIDVTVDSNPTNAFVRPLRRWAVERQLRRVRLRVSLHARLPHPFITETPDNSCNGVRTSAERAASIEHC